MNSRHYGLMIALSLGGLAVVGNGDEFFPDLTKPKDAGPFFHIFRSAKGGFMDASGNTVIQPRFDEEGYFFSGLARVKIGRLWGFVNEAGKIVIRPQFEAVGDFRAALAPVRVGKKWGYIDHTGRMLIAPAFQGAAAFREGLARVEIWNRVLCGGKTVRTNDDAPGYVFNIQPDFPDRARDGCVPVDLKIGYIDTTGRLVIPPRFAKAHDFFDGLALVRIDLTEIGKYGFIDRTGAVVIGFQFDEARDFSEGLAAVLVGRRKVNGIRDPGSWGYINRLGKFVIRDQFAEAGNFSEGLAQVSFHNHLGRGYIDKSGKLAIPAQLASAEPFSEGLAEACFEIDVSSWRCVYIDHRARVIINSVQARYPFSGGLAVAQDDKGASFYINKAGRPIAPLEMGTKLPTVSNH
jgi:hypothetical protein